MTFKNRLRISTDAFLSLAAAFNLVLVILSIVSYASTMSSIVNWTSYAMYKTESLPELDYRFLGIITIYTNRGEILSSFWDTTSYLLVAIIAFNIFVLANARSLNIEIDDGRIKRFVLSGFIAFVGILSNWGIMTFLAMVTRDEVVYYQFPTNILVGSGVTSHYIFDTTPWILTALSVSTLIIIIKQLSSHVKGLRESA